MRETGKLKTKMVEKAIRAGRRGAYYDGQGLRLEIKSASSACWTARYQINGKTRYFGLGSAFVFGLAEARDRNRRLVRQKLADGIDPVLTRRAERAAARAAEAKALTFDEAAKRFLEQHSGKWENAQHRAQWQNTLRGFAGPVIGKLPVADIDVALVLKVLEQPVAADRGHPAGPLWMARTETANRLRGRIEQVLDWAKARGHRQGDNPADWSLIGKVLPARGPQVHHAAIDYKNVSAFMTELHAEQGTTARALEFLILTATRTSEVLMARRDEIDLDEAVWTIPAERMKMRKEHKVPLAPEAVALLRDLPTESGNPFVFIGRDAGKPLSRNTLAAVLNKRMKHDATVHGFRSSFRTWSGERTAFANDIAEAALAHIRGKTERAYQRGDLFDKRRALMTAWTQYCYSPPAATGSTVVPLRGQTS
jgi:integrase